jgi:hypothetical protein
MCPRGGMRPASDPRTMAKRIVYHVVPRHDLWAVELGGDGFTEYARTKRAAIERAKHLARRAPLGQVVVHGADGVIQESFTYGQDPPASER